MTKGWPSKMDGDRDQPGGLKLAWRPTTEQAGTSRGLGTTATTRTPAYYEEPGGAHYQDPGAYHYDEPDGYYDESPGYPDEGYQDPTYEPNAPDDTAYLQDGLDGNGPESEDALAKEEQEAYAVAQEASRTSASPSPP